uniref:Uncharacterized protein n=1 Tax=Leptomonas pyrrhocoris RNA virus satellite RNA4 TaxID=2022123 RepID=A0A2R2X359_9VIRU|nr:hypothetical protein [Leptomonas pyrrhocoris RNA virus satellite RNA4]
MFVTTSRGRPKLRAPPMPIVPGLATYLPSYVRVSAGPDAAPTDSVVCGTVTAYSQFDRRLMMFLFLISEIIFDGMTIAERVAASSTFPEEALANLRAGLEAKFAALSQIAVYSNAQVQHVTPAPVPTRGTVQKLMGGHVTTFEYAPLCDAVQEMDSWITSVMDVWAPPAAVTAKLVACSIFPANANALYRVDPIPPFLSACRHPTLGVAVRGELLRVLLMAFDGFLTRNKECFAGALLAVLGRSVSSVTCMTVDDRVSVVNFLRTPAVKILAGMVGDYIYLDHLRAYQSPLVRSMVKLILLCRQAVGPQALAQQINFAFNRDDVAAFIFADVGIKAVFRNQRQLVSDQVFGFSLLQGASAVYQNARYEPAGVLPRRNNGLVINPEVQAHVCYFMELVSQSYLGGAAIGSLLTCGDSFEDTGSPIAASVLDAAVPTMASVDLDGVRRAYESLTTDLVTSAARLAVLRDKLHAVIGSIPSVAMNPDANANAAMTHYAADVGATIPPIAAFSAVFRFVRALGEVAPYPDPQLVENMCAMNGIVNHNVPAYALFYDPFASYNGCTRGVATMYVYGGSPVALNERARDYVDGAADENFKLDHGVAYCIPHSTIALSVVQQGYVGAVPTHATILSFAMCYSFTILDGACTAPPDTDITIIVRGDTLMITSRVVGIEALVARLSTLNGLDALSIVLLILSSNINVEAQVRPIYQLGLFYVPSTQHASAAVTKALPSVARAMVEVKGESLWARCGGDLCGYAERLNASTTIASTDGLVALEELIRSADFQRGTAVPAEFDPFNFGAKLRNVIYLPCEAALHESGCDPVTFLDTYAARASAGLYMSFIVRNFARTDVSHEGGEIITPVALPVVMGVDDADRITIVESPPFATLTQHPCGTLRHLSAGETLPANALGMLMLLVPGAPPTNAAVKFNPGTSHTTNTTNDAQTIAMALRGKTSICMDHGNMEMCSTTTLLATSNVASASSWMIENRTPYC